MKIIQLWENKLSNTIRRLEADSAHIYHLLSTSSGVSPYWHSMYFSHEDG